MSPILNFFISVIAATAIGVILYYIGERPITGLLLSKNEKSEEDGEK